MPGCRLPLHPATPCSSRLNSIANHHLAKARTRADPIQLPEERMGETMQQYSAPLAFPERSFIVQRRENEGVVFEPVQQLLSTAERQYRDMEAAVHDWSVETGSVGGPEESATPNFNTAWEHHPQHQPQHQHPPLIPYNMSHPYHGGPAYEPIYYNTYPVTGSPTSSTDPDSEQKRLRNTAASARFRAKKKKREQSLERASLEKRQQVQRLEKRVGELEEENRWLKDLVWEKGRRGETREEKEEEMGKKEGERNDGVGTN